MPGKHNDYYFQHTGVRVCEENQNSHPSITSPDYCFMKKHWCIHGFFNRLFNVPNMNCSDLRINGKAGDFGWLQNKSINVPTMPGTNEENQFRIANTELNRRIVMAENLHLTERNYTSTMKPVKKHTIIRRTNHAEENIPNRTL